MKTFTTLMIAMAIGALNVKSIAQTDVSLSITHVLDDQLFGYFDATATPEGDSMSVTRMDYYLSQFTVVHDNGQTTLFDSTWALVSAGGDPTLIELGSASIADVEGIRFYIGVEEEFNHLDPSTYETGHPLAHHFPSMHWGWTSGYRFVAMEGRGGESLDQTYELHGLGDENYFEASIDVSAAAENGEVEIAIFGDYTKALTGIDVSTGLIVHDVGGEAKTLVENFSDFVFSSTADLDTAGQGTAVQEVGLSNDIQIVENPSSDHSIVLRIADNATGNFDINVYDLAGKLMAHQTVISTGNSVVAKDMSSGVYLVNVTSKDSGERITKKAIVK